jgi:S-DNA-T family DNA segregation ATPase FtsK/SpoIIIE
MGKNKKRKDDKKLKAAYSTELNGLIVILIAIIGIGRFGMVGDLVDAFSMFLVGTWSRILLMIIFLVGIYGVLKREWPKFFNHRLIGFYLFAIAILVLSHVEYVKLNDIAVINIFRETIDNFMNATRNPDIIQGGGIIGAIFATLSVKLFDINGTMIVVGFILVFGVIVLFDISPIDKLKWLWNKIRGVSKFKVNVSSDVKEVEEKYEKDNKIVISSIDELEEIKEEKTEKPIIENDGIKIIEPIVSTDKSYTLPPMSLLNSPNKNRSGVNPSVIEKNIEALEKVLNDFGLTGKVVEVNIGPSVTQYEMELKAGTKVSRLLSINREISLALAAKDVRIQAPIPGKNTIGVEIPNPETTMVTVREILESIPASMQRSKLLVVLGKNIMGRSIYAEINNAPHLLVAGATGSGKSVCINCIIASILMRCRPDEVKLMLVDPKKVELSSYNGIPHLIAPVVTDPKKASIALKKIVCEMEQRYDLFNQVGVKNIAGYNSYVDNKNKNGEQIKRMPYIVVIIDELADLMIVAAKEVEESITRITQLARAAGIHLIVATQRPSTDVITGLIKANIPSRISFAVSSSIDSRTILDMSGAEKLLGKGDMLFLPLNESTPIRVQGSFISEDEINRLINFVINQQKAEYDEKLTKLEEQPEVVIKNDEQEEYDDPLYNDIVEFIIRTQKVSASLLQRKYRLGYNRAARIVDLLEERGIIGPQNGSKPREVLVKLEENNNNDDNDI